MIMTPFRNFSTLAGIVYLISDIILSMIVEALLILCTYVYSEKSDASPSRIGLLW